MNESIEEQLASTIRSLTLKAEMMERYAYLPPFTDDFYREKLGMFALDLQASITALKHVEALIQGTHPILKGENK